MKSQHRTNEWSMFASVQTLAYYSPLEDHIRLEKMTEERLQEIFQSDKLDFDNIKSISLINHEWQHWVDYTSTLWGMKKMVKMYNAYNAWLIRREENFLHIKTLFDDFKQDKFLNYYTQILNKIHGNGKEVWQLALNVGHRFNDDGSLNMNKPLLLVRFASNAGIDIARVPVSIASMLECNAMFQEFATKSLFIDGLNEDDKMLETRSLHEYIYKWLYNPDMTLYTVIAHITANTLQITSPLRAFYIASVVSNIVLNLPEKAIKQLTIPNAHLLWGPAGLNLLANRDKGYLFLMILENYTSKYGVGATFNIENLIEASNLPSANEIEEMLFEEIDSYISTHSIEGPLNHLMNTKIDIGRSLLKLKGVALDKKASITIADLSSLGINKPVMICHDTYIDTEPFDINDIIMRLDNKETISYEEWYKIYELCEPKFQEFIQVCGV